MAMRMRCKCVSMRVQRKVLLPYTAAPPFARILPPFLPHPQLPRCSYKLVQVLQPKFYCNAHCLHDTKFASPIAFHDVVDNLTQLKNIACLPHLSAKLPRVTPHYTHSPAFQNGSLPRRSFRFPRSPALLARTNHAALV